MSPYLETNSRIASERRLGGPAVTDAASKSLESRSYTDEGRVFTTRPSSCNVLLGDQLAAWALMTFSKVGNPSWIVYRP